MGIDGEAWALEGMAPALTYGYRILQASDGSILKAPKWRVLSTAQIFEWLIDLRRRHRDGSKRYKFVAFGASFDVNHFVRDLVPVDLARLLAFGSVHVDVAGKHYIVSWRRGKQFALTYVLPRKHGRKARRRVTLTVYDVRSFTDGGFTSFVRGLDPKQPDLKMFERMKSARNEFTAMATTTKGRRRIASYNDREVRVLADCMALLDAAVREAGFVLEHFHGSGALAMAILKTTDVKAHHGDPLGLPFELQEAMARAYFGGRFQTQYIGNTHKALFGYDVNSAYPAVMRTLPCSQHGRWERIGDDGWSLYRIRFSTNPKGSIQPLLGRNTNGSIYSPGEVEGWYWRPEYVLACEYANRFGGRVDLLDCWTWVSECDCRPFESIVESLYANKSKTKGTNPILYLVYKKGLNSLYGKLCQTLGWRIDEATGSLKPPPYFDPFWAGYITSFVRAQVFRPFLESGHLSDMVAISTDGIISRRPLVLDMGPALGQWQAVEGAQNGGIFFGSGNYVFYDSDGNIDAKSARLRGYGVETIAWQAVLRGWEDRLRAISIPTRDFIGLGSILGVFLAPLVDERNRRLTLPQKGPAFERWLDLCGELRSRWGRFIDSEKVVSLVAANVPKVLPLNYATGDPAKSLVRLEPDTFAAMYAPRDGLSMPTPWPHLKERGVGVADEANPLGLHDSQQDDEGD